MVGVRERETNTFLQFGDGGRDKSPAFGLLAHARKARALCCWKIHKSNYIIGLKRHVIINGSSSTNNYGSMASSWVGTVGIISETAW